MKKRRVLQLAVFLFCLVCWMGVGWHWSGSAAADLREELTLIHGEPYTGREVDGGTEDMAFNIVSSSFFMTNPSWRRFWGVDYKYTCTVTRTRYRDGKVETISQTIYHAVDPMGPGDELVRAHLIHENVKSVSATS